MTRPASVAFPFTFTTPAHETGSSTTPLSSSVEREWIEISSPPAGCPHLANHLHLHLYPFTSKREEKRREREESGKDSPT